MERRVNYYFLEAAAVGREARHLSKHGQHGNVWPGRCLPVRPSDTQRLPTDDRLCSRNSCVALRHIRENRKRLPGSRRCLAAASTRCALMLFFRAQKKRHPFPPLPLPLRVILHSEQRKYPRRPSTPPPPPLGGCQEALPSWAAARECEAK